MGICPLLCDDPQLPPLFVTIVAAGVCHLSLLVSNGSGQLLNSVPGGGALVGAGLIALLLCVGNGLLQSRQAVLLGQLHAHTAFMHLYMVQCNRPNPYFTLSLIAITPAWSRVLGYESDGSPQSTGLELQAHLEHSADMTFFGVTPLRPVARRGRQEHDNHLLRGSPHKDTSAGTDASAQGGSAHC